MRNQEARSLSCLGIGFFTLDIIVRKEQPLLDSPAFADVGGSCGNVLGILGYLGWAVAPVVRLGSDIPSRMFLQKFKALRGDLSCVVHGNGDDLPIIIEYIKSKNGVISHSFSVFNPKKGVSRFPGYRAVTLKQLEAMGIPTSKFDVVYMDRLSPSCISVARQMSEAGSCVFVEPQRVSAEDMARVIPYANIIKASEGKLPYIDQLRAHGSRSILIIETLGKQGLRYRLVTAARKAEEWTHLSATRHSSVVDTAGAGDWTTAGLISGRVFDAMSDTRTRLHTVIATASGWGETSVLHPGPMGLIREVPEVSLRRILSSAVPINQYGKELKANQAVDCWKKASGLGDLLAKIGW